MKRIIALLVCGYALACHAQTIDTAPRLAASYFKEAEIAAKDQHVWKEKVYGRTMFVDPQTRMTYANMPDSAGLLKPAGDIFTGILPKDVMLANTAIYWQGKMWSVMLWPLYGDRDDRTNLVLHESFHRIQQQMGFPERSPTVDHLSSMYGRIYFLLELQALRAALGKPLDQRGADLNNALLFRQKRQLLFPDTYKNERILEMSEGLAEYTGVILGRPKDHILQHLYDQIDTAGNRKSLIRSCAYITGPVYGYLLYQKAPDWTLKIDSNSDFPVLISNYYHIALPKYPGDEALTAIAKKYNGDAIIQSEKIKEEQRLQIADQYIDLFTRKPVLTLTLVKMGIEFNPNTLFDLGEYGTVYPTAQVKDNWGQLIVSAGGMLMKDWQVITLSAENIGQNDRTVTGNGWKLVLNQGWELMKVDALHYKLISKN